MRLIFLGTSGSAPTKDRGLPSMAIEHSSELFLFDCGEGTQRQMMQFSINVSKIKAIFLTHIHGDHTIGLAGIVRTLALNRRTAPLDVFIPEDSSNSINALLGFDKAVMGYPINIKQVKQGRIYKGRDFSIYAFKLKHTAPTFGFVFKENDKLRFIKPKIKKLGLKGTMFRTILSKKSTKIGNKTIKLKDITVNKPGRKIVYATDTRPMASTIKAAVNADILIHESTYAASEGKLSKERLHSTSIEGATIARKANAKRLLLVHPSARYKDTSILVNEAKKIFKNTEMAKDGMIINL